MPDAQSLLFADGSLAFTLEGRLRSGVAVTFHYVIQPQTLAAYIDLNPVQTGMVEDPADYRRTSYGEAVGGGAKGNGKQAREGLVRAYFCGQGVVFKAGKWPDVSRWYRRLMGLALGRKPECSESKGHSQTSGTTTKNTTEMLESKEFLNEAFMSARDRFGP